MDAVSKREKPQLDLDSLDIHALKALLIAKQSELDSRNTEIEIKAAYPQTQANALRPALREVRS
jgi:hypothetical protein